jgi:serine/threonine-protein kinase
MRDVHLLQPGTQLDGRYEVLRLLGQGGMAAVYQVRHLGLDSLHALKVLNPELARSDDLRGRFLAEGRIQARLRHPHIVQVTEIVTSPVAGLVMDYVEGPTLGDFCRADPTPGLEPALLLEVFLPVLDAVEEAHRHNVVHRDLKPDNIIIGRDSRGRLQPKVTDFGIAKVLEAELGGGKARTQTGTRMGTLLYMSPEQIRGASEVDARADIFSLGAILYEAATGQVAFDAPSDYETMRRIVEGDLGPLERVVGGLPPVIAGCIRKALAVDPAERFQDCASFRAALEKALEPGAEVPEKPSRSYAVTRPGGSSALATPAPAARPAFKPEDALAPTFISTPAPAVAPAPAMATPAAAVAPVPVVAPAPALAARPPAPQPARPVNRMPGNTVSPLAPMQARGIPPNPHTSPFAALLLSLLCLAGLGQLYNQQVTKGLVILGLSVALSVSTVGVCWPVLNIVFAIDAYSIAAKRRSGRSVSAWEFF